MNITHQHALLIVGALVLGYIAGKHGLAASSSAATAHNDTNQASDWWSFAGSWSA